MKDNFIEDLIEKLFIEDQEIRSNLSTIDDNKLLEVSKRHIKIIKSLIDKSDKWPFYSEDKVSKYCLVLILHADSDVGFQQEGLKKVSLSMGKDEGLKYWFAFLYDRIQVNLGRPQRFGTQVEKVDGNKVILYDLEDRGQLKNLRIKYNLDSITKYKQNFNKRL